MSWLVKNLHACYNSGMCTPRRLAFIFGSCSPQTLKLHEPDGEGTIGIKNVDNHLQIYTV